MRVLKWAARLVVAWLAVNGVRLVVADVRRYWPTFVEQLDLAKFEAENGGTPFVRP